MSAEPTSSAPVEKKRLGMTTRVVLALLLGSAVGVFFGETTAWMKVLGDVYIGLLQMTVLPYITVSLLVSIGRLTWGEGKRLMGWGAAVLLGLWLLGLVVVYLSPLALPHWETGSFFTPSMLESPPAVDFLDLFLPLNIFGSLARNVVPAVVVFCLAVGVALIGMPKKDRLLDMLDTVSEALMRVNKAIVGLTPYGVFAIAAGVASTMTIQEIGRIQGYLIAYTVLSLYLALVFLPLLISALTPFSYREILRSSKGALVTAFATGKVLIVLPLLIESTKELFAAKHAEGAELDVAESNRSVEVMYPLAYPFPSLGKVLTLIFVPFAAWFSGQALEMTAYPTLLVAGLFSMFGGPVVAIPFLLEMNRLPADLFQLFIASGVWTMRVGDFLSTMHLVAMAVVTTSAVTGLLKVRLRAVIQLVVVSVVVVVACLVGMRAYLAGTLEDAEDPADIIARMTLQTADLGIAPETRVLDEAAPNPEPLRDGESVLDRIARRGVLRVGFGEGRMPWSYRNATGDVIGFDIDLASRLAAEMEVDLELVPIDVTGLVEHLEADHVDLVISGIQGTTRLAQTTSFSGAYLDLHLAFLVHDTRVRDFRTLDRIRALEKPVIGTLQSTELESLLPRLVDGLEVRRLPDVMPFLEGRDPDVDALLVGAEGGAFWTLAYPRFRVVRPRDTHASVPLVIPYPRDDDRLGTFLNHWLALAKDGGKLERLHAHWIQGDTATQKAPRWSVIRDVLHWVD